MTKIIESIKFDGINLNDIFKLECVDGIVKDDDEGFPVAVLKDEYKMGELWAAIPGTYLCKFSNGMWQVFGKEAYMNELKK